MALYKYLLNAFPLLSLSSSPSTLPISPDAYTSFGEPEIEDVEKGFSLRSTPVTRRLSAQAQAHQEWVRKRTKRWHAVMAGALAGGLGLLFEKRGRRVNIAQQLFVRLVKSLLFLLLIDNLNLVQWGRHFSRGLQGSYNALSTKHNIKVPFGPIIVFSLW